jgi:plastocyanin
MKGFRNRILAPLAIPVGASVIIATVAFNYSRILLFLEKRNNSAVSTAVAVVVASVILFGSNYFSSRREARTVGLALLGTATMVLLFAGGYGSGAGHAVETAGGGGAAGGGGEVTTGATEFAYAPKELSAPSGIIKVNLKNDGRSLHTFVLEGVTKFKKIEAPPGTTGSGAVQLSAGTYTFYCSELGHRGSGMEGKLTVTRAGKG